MVHIFKSLIVVSTLAVAGIALPYGNITAIFTDMANVNQGCTLVNGDLTAFIQNSTVAGAQTLQENADALAQEIQTLSNDIESYGMLPHTDAERLLYDYYAIQQISVNIAQQFIDNVNSFAALQLLQVVAGYLHSIHSCLANLKGTCATNVPGDLVAEFNAAFDVNLKLWREATVCYEQ